MALDNLREALPHYTKLADIAVSGTPLSNQDAIAYSNLATSCVCLCCRGWDGLGVSAPIFRFLDGFAVQSGSANNGYYVR